MTRTYDEIERAMQREFEENYDEYGYEFTESEVNRVYELLRDGEDFDDAITTVCCEIAEGNRYNDDYDFDY